MTTAKIENRIGRLTDKGLDELQDFQGDLKELSRESFEKLKTSFLRHGNIAPVFVWNGNILDGHQRVKTLRQLQKDGIAIPDKIPCVEINAGTEKEAKRYLLQYVSQQGRVTEDGLHHFLTDAGLDEELEALKLELSIPDLDMEAFEERFSTDDGPDDGKEDDTPAVPREARSKAGDLYEIGDHLVLCGDATKKEDVERLMGGNKANMVFTDPPYNVAYGDSKNPRYTAHVSGKHKLIENDDLNKDEWVAFNVKLTEIFKLYCIGDIYVWGSPSPDGMRQRLSFIDNGIHWSATIIWKKQRLVLAAGKYQRIYEPCFYGWAEGDTSSFCGDRKKIEVWEFDRPHKSDLHPTMKPVELCENGILNSSKKGSTYKRGGIVLDPFLGSGSTLIACEKTKRKCYGMEIDPLYCDVIVQRYVDYTGNRKIKLNGNVINWKDIDSSSPSA